MQGVQPVRFVRWVIEQDSYTRTLVWCVTALAVVVLAGVQCQADQGMGQEVKAPDSFESCIAAGGQVQRGPDVRCTTATGQIFEKPVKAARAACKDLCGDGKCQEMVCMAVGCPCAETVATCPADCKNAG